MTEKPKTFRIRYQPYVSRFFELVITPKTVSWFIIEVEKISLAQNAGPFREASPHVIETITDGHIVSLSKVASIFLSGRRQDSNGKLEDTQRLNFTIDGTTKTTFDFPTENIRDAFLFLINVLSEQ